jgi:2-keto-3-deoxy-L-rhamnonate aldolase RhmA
LSKKAIHMQLATVVGALMVVAGPALASATQTAIDETTKAHVRQAIEKYIERDAQLKEAFLIIDPRTEEPLRLAFDNVHAGVELHEKGYVGLCRLQGPGREGL